MQQTPLSQGNAALRNKDYEAAIRHYNRALAQHPALAAMLQSNIDLAYQRGGIPKPAAGTVPVATVDIVVPVYNALEDVKKCLESLQRCTDGLTVKVIVVNDGSDEATTQWLREYCGGKPVFKLIEHEKNAGYTKAVNIGLKAATADYAITQNSDTIVSPGWLTGLIRCMNSSPTIGIVGPLSNAAGWQNVPNLRDEQGDFAVNELPAGYTVNDMARVVQQASTSAYPRLPFVNGFCFMIKRAVINAIGYMDEENFPVGYGEENDYCIRAIDAGFELAIADDVYVFHAKSKSFGHERRKELSKAGTEGLKAKHTAKKYSEHVAATKRSDQLFVVRENIRATIEEGRRAFDTNIEPKNAQPVVKGPNARPIKSAYKTKIESAKGDLILGWSVNTRNPAETFDIEVWLDGYYFITVKNIHSRLDLKKANLSNGLGGISFSNPAMHLTAGAASISLRLPDGTFSEAVEIECKKINRQQHIDTARPLGKLTIIVPIFNAPADLEICIERLLSYTPSYAKILLIDDHSTDPRINEILSRHQHEPAIRTLKNAENLGFTRTVNRGIEESDDDDVVLLNSDARVTPRWLEGLLTAAHSAPRIATVTAMSDRAGAFSAPQMGNDNKLPDGVDEISYARAFRRRSLGLYPRVPTGNGFCMYVSRECIRSIGQLDSLAFPRGYGEENDFCMRALRAGWLNIIDDRTYVFHDRSKSFGEAKTELMKAGRTVVDARYPEYKKAIQVFSTNEKIALARNRARVAEQDCVADIGTGWVPRVLFVIATQTGGTPQTNRDLMQALSGVFEGWVLRCDSKILELTRMNDDGTNTRVRVHALQEPVDPLTHNSAEYDALVYEWLLEFDFELVHIRHLGWHGLSLPRLARQTGAKVIYSFHDFYALSSTFKLIDDCGVFLGNSFLEDGSVYRESLWPKDALPTPSGDWLMFWRERFQAALEYCDAFVTTADSARSLILQAMPRLHADRFVVIPHGRDFPTFHRIRQKPIAGEPIRVLVPGHINAVKGLEVIRELTKLDKEGRLEFHILGRLIGERPKRGVFIHGEYQRQDFADKARSVRPHLGIIFSVWDETYCHTLTELWSVGLPAAVFDYPNVAGRVQRSGAGWVLDQHNIPKLYEEIISLAFDEKEYHRTEQALTDWQTGYGIANSTDQMANGYLNLYSDVLREGRGEKVALSPYSRKRIGVLCQFNPVIGNTIDSPIRHVQSLVKNKVERPVTYIKLTADNFSAIVRAKMLDAMITHEKLGSPIELDFALKELAKSSIPCLTDIRDEIFHKTQSSFDEAVLAALRAASQALTTFTHEQTVKISQTQLRIAVCVHVFYVHRWDLISNYLDNIHHDFDLFVTCPAEIVSNLKNITEKYPQVRMVTTENFGMDVLPFINVLQKNELWRYDVILKLHTKNDKNEMGEVLGKILLDGVLGTPTLVNKIIDELAIKNFIGMIGAECMYRSAPKIMKPNRPTVEKILDSLAIRWPDYEWGFFAGTMFWVRGSMLKDIALNYEKVVAQVHAEEKISVTGGDGKWAHAMERFLGLLPVLNGKAVAVSYPSNELGAHTHIRIVSPVELDTNKTFSRRSSYFVLRYKNLAAWAMQCRNSVLFDEKYYRKHAGAALPKEMDAATHFVLYGDGLGLNPSSSFSAVAYLRQNSDVANALFSMPSLIHYLNHGMSEGRDVYSVTN